MDTAATIGLAAAALILCWQVTGQGNEVLAMPTLGCSPSPAVTDGMSDTVVTPQHAEVPLHVYSCSRLGLQANPPSFRLNFSWFRRR